MMPFDGFAVVSGKVDGDEFGEALHTQCTGFPPGQFIVNLLQKRAQLGIFKTGNIPQARSARIGSKHFLQGALKQRERNHHQHIFMWFRRNGFPAAIVRCSR